MQVKKKCLYTELQANGLRKKDKTCFRLVRRKLVGIIKSNILLIKSVECKHAINLKCGSLFVFSWRDHKSM